MYLDDLNFLKQILASSTYRPQNPSILDFLKIVAAILELYSIL